MYIFKIILDDLTSELIYSKKKQKKDEIYNL